MKKFLSILLTIVVLVVPVMETAAFAVPSAVTVSDTVAEEEFSAYEEAETEKTGEAESSTATLAETSGTCGTNLTWTLDDEGTLTISGTGAMTDSPSGSAPWNSSRSSIKKVVISDGVTIIGKYAFSNCDSLASVEIPNSVTNIGFRAFYDCDSLASVEIPNSVTSIGNYAFSYCMSLASVEIPNSVKGIGAYAFYNSVSLASIEIPNSVISIGDHAFSKCTSLASITVDAENKYYSNDERGVLFNKDKTTLVQYPIGNTATSYEIPSGVTSIGKYAFYYCGSLEKAIIPASVTSIGTNAFSYCSKLTIYGYSGTYAETYANSNNIPFVDINSLPKSFDSSMQAFLNLESVVTMSVGYKLEGMEDINPEEHLDKMGLLIWDAGEITDESQATYDNCGYIIEGAEYNSTEGRFESTTDGIVAKNMGDSLTFRAYYLNDDGSYSYSRLISNYSPKTYCYNQINNNPDDEIRIALMASILNYGAAAQTHFEYNTDNLMNSDLSEELKALNWDGTLVRSDYSVPGSKDAAFVRADEITSRGGYLNLVGAIDYNFYSKVDFAPESATIYYWTEEAVNNLDELTISNATSSEKMTYNAVLERYEGKYEGQPAKKLFETVYALMVFEDENGEEFYSGVVGYSPERFAYINQDKGNTTAELSKRLAVYGDAARTYFND